MLFFRCAFSSYPPIWPKRIANSNVLDSFFKTLVDHEVTVELKNDIQIRGTLKSVDQYLNIKLDNISVMEEMKYPHLVSTPISAEAPLPSVPELRCQVFDWPFQSSVKNVFIRGSVVRYVHLPGSAVDTALLEDGLLYPGLPLMFCNRV